MSDNIGMCYPLQEVIRTAFPDLVFTTGQIMALQKDLEDRFGQVIRAQSAGEALDPAGTASRDWQPTPANTNALPDPVRRYIMHLETDCDPAGTIRSEVILREHTVPELQALVAAQASALAEARRALATSDAELVRSAILAAFSSQRVWNGKTLSAKDWASAYIEASLTQDPARDV